MTTTEYLDGYRAALTEVLARVLDDVPVPEDQSADHLRGWAAARREFKILATAFVEPQLTTFEDDGE